MMSASHNVNVNVNVNAGGVGVTRNIRDAAMLVQNGSSTNGRKFVQRPAPPTHIAAPAAAKGPAVRPSSSSSLQPPPAYQLTVAHSAGHVNGLQLQQRPAARPAQVYSLQQQVERFVQQQAAHAHDSPYLLPASQSASSLGAAYNNSQSNSNRLLLTHNANHNHNHNPNDPHLVAASPHLLQNNTAPHNVVHAPGRNQFATNQQSQSRPNDAVSFSLVGRHSRAASNLSQTSANSRPNTAPLNSNVNANVNINVNAEKSKPLIYAPRSVIADTYLKQEQKSDSKGQSQRFLDVLNHIRSQQQQSAADGNRSGFSLLQPDYNYVVDNVDKVHVRINTPRNMHRRASITDSTEDVRRVAQAVALSDHSDENMSSSPKGDLPQLHSAWNSDVKVRSILKSSSSSSAVSRPAARRVAIDPRALLLDAALEGELETVRTMCSATDPSAANDEGITALHNAVCAGHLDICRFLIQSAGVNVNSADADGWTPLHCAASCSNLELVKLLVEHGACPWSRTTDDLETPLDKCEPSNRAELADERDDSLRRPRRNCRDFLLEFNACVGVANERRVFCLFDYDACSSEELTVKMNEPVTVVQRLVDEHWSVVRNREGREGYVPHALLSLFPRKLK